MYNEKAKCWLSDNYNRDYLDRCKAEPEKDAEALFALADVELAVSQKGKGNSETVYMMESAAKKNNPKAAFAMGQMFQYGWAVHKNPKKAEEWYRKAAELGYSQAEAYLKRNKKAKLKKIILATLIFVLLIGFSVGAFLFIMSDKSTVGIIVDENTELIQVTTPEEFRLALNDIISENDNELVISGQLSSNRLLLKFEGDGIDLSKFPAATVLADEENYLVIQFVSEEDAELCLKNLRKNKSVLFVDMDDYVEVPQHYAPSEHISTSVPYTSNYNGLTYNSWGVEFMGYDRFAQWLTTQDTEQVVVAVVDTGSEPCPENEQYYLEGFDANDPSLNGWNDTDGHGTHVAGIVIDCVRGLDVKILPVKVFLPEGAPTSYIVEGLRYAISEGVDVINMSLGGLTGTVSNGDAECGSPKDYYIKEAIKNNIVVVVAAGNGDDYGNPINTNLFCPAHNDCAIIVSACDSTGNLASFSNYGDSVDVCAPGYEILSNIPGNDFDIYSGTSMAAPHIAALAAMLKLYQKDKTPAQIEKYIKDYCTDMGNKLYYGEGIPWLPYFAGN